MSEARSEAKRLLSSAPEAKAVSMTFVEARPLYLEENFRGSTSRWPHIVNLLLSNHFKAFEDKQLADIADADIRRALDKLADRPSQQLHAYRAVRAFLKWCSRPPRRYLPHSPMEGYAPPGKDRKGSRILSDEELKAVWNAAESGSRSVFRLLILWGTRNAETTSIERK